MTPDTFLDTLLTRPGMIMGRSEHPLHRMQAFIEGLRWHDMLASTDLAAVLPLLTNLPAHIAGVDPESGNSVGWFDILMERCGNDEQKAFDEAVSALRSLARACPPP